MTRTQKQVKLHYTYIYFNFLVYFIVNTHEHCYDDIID